MLFETGLLEMGESVLHHHQLLYHVGLLDVVTQHVVLLQLGILHPQQLLLHVQESLVILAAGQFLLQGEESLDDE